MALFSLGPFSLFSSFRVPSWEGTEGERHPHSRIYIRNRYRDTEEAVYDWAMSQQEQREEGERQRQRSTRQHLWQPQYAAAMTAEVAEDDELVREAAVVEADLMTVTFLKIGLRSHVYNPILRWEREDPSYPPIFHLSLPPPPPPWPSPETANGTFGLRSHARLLRDYFLYWNRQQWPPPQQQASWSLQTKQTISDEYGPWYGSAREAFLDILGGLEHRRRISTTDATRSLLSLRRQRDRLLKRQRPFDGTTFFRFAFVGPCYLYHLYGGTPLQKHPSPPLPPSPPPPPPPSPSVPEAIGEERKRERRRGSGKQSLPPLPPPAPQLSFAVQPGTVEGRGNPCLGYDLRVGGNAATAFFTFDDGSMPVMLRFPSEIFDCWSSVAGSGRRRRRRRKSGEKQQPPEQQQSDLSFSDVQVLLPRPIAADWKSPGEFETTSPPPSDATDIISPPLFSTDDSTAVISSTTATLW